MELRPTPQAPIRHRRTVGGIGVALLIAAAALVLTPLAIGLDHSVVRDEAMGAATDSGMWHGSLSFTKEVSGASLSVGDVVRFVPPAPWSAEGPVTRRIVSTRDGTALTRGDAVAALDPWRIDLDVGLFHQVSLRLPWVGLIPGGSITWWTGIGLVALAAVSTRVRPRRHWSRRRPTVGHVA